jgi:prepilin-type N-terminal cleavage/methylation domain-containing protein
MNIQRKEKGKGFTIIEVVLVLAIAGLIFMMVFIALPALQRGQRDTQRRSDLSRLNSQLSSYQSNNRGAIPLDQAAWSAFVISYMRVGGDEFADPSGTPYEILVDADGGSVTTAFDGKTIFVTPGATCDGEVADKTGQGARKVAFQMKLEGAGVSCVSN